MIEPKKIKSSSAEEFNNRENFRADSYLLKIIITSSNIDRERIDTLLHTVLFF